MCIGQKAQYNLNNLKRRYLKKKTFNQMTAILTLLFDPFHHLNVIFYFNRFSVQHLRYTGFCKGLIFDLQKATELEANKHRGQNNARFSTQASIDAYFGESLSSTVVQLY